MTFEKKKQRKKRYLNAASVASILVHLVISRNKITHMEVKPSKCSYCHKTFAHSIQLKNHERTHTGERPVA